MIDWILYKTRNSTIIHRIPGGNIQTEYKVGNEDADDEDGVDGDNDDAEENNGTGNDEENS